ncbi:elongation factor 1-gamma [Coniophora puteana RWD-64-598 SS2]|uniref:Elongation factor 1-gamma n=1 Tax=Coniophora puteana (strain RWD-64-598) TaxID=741705 RepID=A0A5M3MBF9_CONPW|nr:elongation factor 1-gamma [Coniophora puteana RWD-64-598 SS2]EIW76579.1 elongation factor 1-gamma [Coniophora puteana RWD-64-598 SS2]
MAPVGTLWHVESMWQSVSIKSVAALTNQELAYPESYTHFETNKTPEFLAKFPHGKIPALELADGRSVTEGVVIAQYLASLAPNSGLLGQSKEDEIEVAQWIHFIESEIQTYNQFQFQLVMGFLAPYAKPIRDTFHERALRGLMTVETHLATRTYLVGERLTLADIVLAAVNRRSFDSFIDALTRAKLVNTLRHFETVSNKPALKPIFGSITYAETAVQFKPPAKEKKEPKPAPAPKAAAKPKAAEEEEEESFADEKPKEKNPLDLLPKSNFNLEDWKRAYSNKETRGAGGALEWFYENFDKDGFSVWRVDFKYNEELTQVFMSSNQIGGFFNRLEASRKYLFGSVGVLGENNASVISGALILRGQEAKPVVEAAPDWESYDYKKLDLSNEEDKKFFEAALAWDLEVDGKAWKDGKNFK